MFTIQTFPVWVPFREIREFRSFFSGFSAPYPARRFRHGGQVAPPGTIRTTIPPNRGF